MKRNSKAFTLAEVLVVLVIVGIVASLAIPSLISHIQNKKISTTVKKAYSILNQSTIQINVENRYWDYTISNDRDREDAAIQSYSNYMPYIKKGRTDELMPNNGAYKYLGTNDYYTFPAASPVIYLKNGMLIRLVTYNNCNKAEQGVSNICAIIYVDANGQKEPNTMGKDLARFFVSRQNNMDLTVIPSGALIKEGENDYCTSGDSTDNDDSLNCTVFHLLDKSLPE